MVGLVLFHDHSHGGHGHSHGHAHDEEGVDAAEQGHNHEHLDGSEFAGQDAAVRVHPRAVYYLHVILTSLQGVIAEPTAAYSRRRTLDSQYRVSRGYSNPSRGFEDIGGHPASMRQDIISAASRNQFPDQDDIYDSDTPVENGAADGFGPTERSTLLGHKDRASNYTDENAIVQRQSSNNDPHKNHNHAQPKPKEQKHGHDLNMRGVFLHVMGDALGNIGVIVSALVIWLTDYSWRFYVDPGISLVITVIILASAIPLCKAASRILLQAVPHGVSIDHIKEDIERLPGVIGSHHLHVWQLSDTKTVASIHIQVDTEIKGEGSERYMHLAKQVRQCLHAYGIHSSTIQPEFPQGSDTEDNQVAGSSHSQSGPSRTPSVGDGDPQACLLECGDECGGKHCCPTKPT